VAPAVPGRSAGRRIVEAPAPDAAEPLERIAQLYAIENEIRGRPPDERRQFRQARARPVLESLHEWLESCLAKLSRKSDTTVAVRYALTLWDALVRYCDNGQLEIDTDVSDKRNLEPTFASAPFAFLVACSGNGRRQSRPR
jgi:transposase